MEPSFLDNLGINSFNYGTCVGGQEWMKDISEELLVINPSDETLIAKVGQATQRCYNDVIDASLEAFNTWRMVPAPERGQLILEIANELRIHKSALGSLVALEMGKIKQEGEGEVQEMIDIADFAVGLSRQLYGLTMHSERYMHRMYEQWHPLGITCIISAFNFPVAVWSWNAFIAAACGNVSIWKPSEKTPLTAIAIQKICNKVLEKNNLKGIFNLIIGDKNEIGNKLLQDERIPLVSFTGSTNVGRHVAKIVSERFGKTILELGGNNAIIIDKTANLKLAVPATVFGAVGTAGQRCTSTRRVLVHENIYDEFKKSIVNAYKQVRIGNPLQPDTLMGPLIDKQAVDMYKKAIENAIQQGGKVVYGNEIIEGNGFFVKPTIIEISHDAEIVHHETFAPILYLVRIQSVKEAVEINNEVKQGLSSAIFTDNLKHSEYFLSHLGSDCGIANVNIGTSGAEIGGAFGGEKETGGGREAGSDSWKAYMRRQTNTINWSSELPLAQGIKFEIDN